MHFLRFILAILFSCLLFNLLQAQQNVGIGTITPNSSAMQENREQAEAIAKLK